MDNNIYRELILLYFACSPHFLAAVDVDYYYYYYVQIFYYKPYCVRVCTCMMRMTNILDPYLLALNVLVCHEASHFSFILVIRALGFIAAVYVLDVKTEQSSGRFDETRKLNLQPQCRHKDKTSVPNTKKIE